MPCFSVVDSLPARLHRILMVDNKITAWGPSVTQLIPRKPVSIAQTSNNPLHPYSNLKSLPLSEANQNPSYN